MANFKEVRLTKAGRILQAKAETGTPLKLTRFKIGSGQMTWEEADVAIDLKEPRESMGITSNTATVDGICKVQCTLTTKGIQEGFYARELGLFAMDPDVGEILYLIALATEPDMIPPESIGAIITVDYSFNIVVSNIDNLSLNIDPSGLVTRGQLEPLARLLQRSTAYKVNDLLYDSRLRPGFFLKCIQSGITSEENCYINLLTLNDTVVDGGVIWQVCKMSVLDGDAFRKVTNGVTTGILQRPADFAEFYQQSDGSITPAPIRFSTPQFMRNAEGDIIAAKVPVQADDDSDDDEPVKEVDVPVATKEDINNIISKFS